MRVGIDGRELQKNRMTGIGRYLLNFLSYALPIKPEWEFIIFGNQNTKISLENSNLRKIFIPEYITLWWDQVQLPYYLEKEKIESDQGSRFVVLLPVSGIPINALQTLPRIISGVADKAIVYVGEKHDRYGDHIVQLEVIKGLYKKHKKLAIGMEMFQKPYQNAIDDYIYLNVARNSTIMT